MQPHDHAPRRRLGEPNKYALGFRNNGILTSLCLDKPRREVTAKSTPCGVKNLYVDYTKRFACQVSNYCIPPNAAPACGDTRGLEKF